MSSQTFIFMGQSGCGKGEQSRRIQKILKERDPDTDIYYLETGPNFRELIKGDKYSNKLAKEIADKGKIQPIFLAVYFWAGMLLNNLKGEEHLIFDGVARRLEEAQVLTTAMEFYNRKPIVIYINVSREWAKERLLGRGRADDLDLEQLTGRLDWFEEYTLPVIDYFRENNQYKFLEINGEQTIEEVHQNILQKLGWDK